MSLPGKTIQAIVLLTLAVVLMGMGYSNSGLMHWLNSFSSPSNESTVARVFDVLISRSQVDRAVLESLWLEGKNMDELTPETRIPVRQTALDDLIDRELLRLKSAAISPQIEVTEAEIDERFNRMSARFDFSNEMENAIKSQGIASGQALRNRLAAIIRQEKFIESRIGPLTQVTDDEARKWFDENQQKMRIPERVEVRHIFIPTLDHPPEEAKAKLDASLADLTAKRKDFTTLAREISEDPATKDSGGSLGWMTRDRLPVDFTAPVFSLPLHQQALIRTRLGWHLVEVTDRKSEEPRNFAEAKPEIIAALETIKRTKSAKEFRATLRQNESSNIEVFPGTITE
ncbi:MAG: peptidylprolyl isomerase [Gloeobacteraceae cyanobacterium ES-bin-144]|nr:peptidylprolyl isomerase [Verrucomicrobiales bacterium]